MAAPITRVEIALFMTSPKILKYGFVARVGREPTHVNGSTRAQKLEHNVLQVGDLLAAARVARTGF